MIEIIIISDSDYYNVFQIQYDDYPALLTKLHVLHACIVHTLKTRTKPERVDGCTFFKLLHELETFKKHYALQALKIITNMKLLWK